jgi:hypothetical protein
MIVLDRETLLREYLFPALAIYTRESWYHSRGIRWRWGLAAGLPWRYLRTVLRARPSVFAISRADFPCVAHSCIVCMVPLLIMGLSCVCDSHKSTLSLGVGQFYSGAALLAQFYTGVNRSYRLALLVLSCADETSSA